jgi:NDP-sugar pyrophosphorylase family protein
MICVLLVAGVEVPLERDLAEDERLRGIPRALLPVGGVPMLDYWWASLLSTREVTSVYLVCR